MTAPRTSYSVGDLAQRLGGKIHGRGDLSISGINSLAQAGPGEITFITTARYARQWPGSRASAALIPDALVAHVPANERAIIAVPDAELAVVTLLELFKPPEPLPDLGIHPSAVIHPDARLGADVRIGPHVSVDRNAFIGDGVVLHAGVRIYAEAAIGAGSVLHANVVVRHRCRIGRGVVLHQGVAIGADGFGYRPDPSGRGLLKVPQIGNVVIEDGVEIGANSCVDRAKFGSTVIGAGTKIDNLCQIAHNCRIGRSCIIAGQSGVAGSTVLGDGVVLGGQVGIIDHLNLGDQARVAAKSAVFRDIPPGESWAGMPAENGQAMLRQWASVRKLPRLLQRLNKEGS